MGIEAVFQIASQVLLFAVLIVAATTDVLYHKVYNWLTYPAIIFGLTLSYAAGGLGNVHGGLTSSALGFMLGGGIFWIAYLTGGVGGGDWKLVGAVGAIKGLEFSVPAIFYSSLFGALLAIVFLAYQGKLGPGLKRTARRAVGLKVEDLPEGDPVMRKLPYGVAVSFGTFFAWTLAEGMLPQ
ncbi:MAG TPA: A24 family peptidase [Planctomycetota bacterium]|nr:A24 family peptidase [Planctomycetota bacterium]